MIYFSDEIINDIIDTSDLEDLLPKLEDFKTNTMKQIIKYSYRAIQPLYIEGLLSDEKNKCVFYCLDNEFHIENCPTILIYHKQNTIIGINYYILFICTKQKFKNLGYASLLLHEFISYIRQQQNGGRELPIKIILSSLETAVTFYESHGFIWTRKSLLEYPLLLKYEKYEEGKEYFMMELQL